MFFPSPLITAPERQRGAAGAGQDPSAGAGAAIPGAIPVNGNWSCGCNPNSAGYEGTPRSRKSGSQM